MLITEVNPRHFQKDLKEIPWLNGPRALLSLQAIFSYRKMTGSSASYEALLSTEPNGQSCMTSLLGCSRRVSVPLGQGSVL